jgi:hypothetical protein
MSAAAKKSFAVEDAWKTNAMGVANAKATSLARFADGAGVDAAEKSNW